MTSGSRLVGPPVAFVIALGLGSGLDIAILVALAAFILATMLYRGALVDRERRLVRDPATWITCPFAPCPWKGSTAGSEIWRHMDRSVDLHTQFQMLAWRKSHLGPGETMGIEELSEMERDVQADSMAKLASIGMAPPPIPGQAKNRGSNR